MTRVSQFIAWDANKAPLRWGPKVECGSPCLPREWEIQWLFLGAPSSDRPGLESQLRLGDFAVPQRLVAPGEAVSVDPFWITVLI